MKKKSEKIGSLVVSLLFGVFLGWYASTLFGVSTSLSNMLNLSVRMVTIAFSLLGLGLIGYLGYKNPRTTELLAFIFSAFIILQVLWDSGAETTFGIWRTIMTYAGLGLFLLNSFTGYLRLNSGLKTIRRSMGGK